jgi:hypothetical protein
MPEMNMAMNLKPFYWEFIVTFIFSKHRRVNVQKIRHSECDRTSNVLTLSQLPRIPSTHKDQPTLIRFSTISNAQLPHNFPLIEAALLTTEAARAFDLGVAAPMAGELGVREGDRGMGARGAGTEAACSGGRL